jgi:histidinol-phosphate/aromatic aminotransferase/cobyric acid decarboxylase-like protein
MQDQVRFVLQSPRLKNPISLPFLPRQRLTTERVLAEIERVIQSNHEFRLNDSVNVNLIHVEMPNGGTGTKRSEINLEKHLINKRSIVRIQNTDETCLARALVVSIAKSENDIRYRKPLVYRKSL